MRHHPYIILFNSLKLLLQSCPFSDSLVLLVDISSTEWLDPNLHVTTKSQTVWIDAKYLWVDIENFAVSLVLEEQSCSILSSYLAIWCGTG